MNIDIRYPNSSVLSYKKKKFDVAEVVLNDANQTSNGKKKKKKFEKKKNSTNKHQPKVYINSNILSVKNFTE